MVTSALRDAYEPALRVTHCGPPDHLAGVGEPMTESFPGWPDVARGDADAIGAVAFVRDTRLGVVRTEQAINLVESEVDRDTECVNAATWDGPVIDARMRPDH